MPDPSSSHRELSPKVDRSLFADLLATSHAIKRVLSPVDVRPSFVSKLREELNANVENARAAFVHRQRRRDKIKWTAIGAGLAVYSVGMSVDLIRLLQWGFSRMRKSTPSPRS